MTSEQYQANLRRQRAIRWEKAREDSMPAHVRLLFHIRSRSKLICDSGFSLHGIRLKEWEREEGFDKLVSRRLLENSLFVENSARISTLGLELIAQWDGECPPPRDMPEDYHDFP